MSLLRKILAIKPVRIPLEFGINENIRLTAISNDVRKRDGEVLNRNIYMTFAKYDSKNKKIAQTEFSYFNLDPTSDFVLDNFVQQIGQLNDLLKAFGLNEVVDPTEGYTTEDEIQKDLRTKAGCANFMKVLWEQFSNEISEHVGEDSILLRLKVVTNSSGEFLQLPRDIHFVEPMDLETSVLNITAYEIRVQRKGVKSSTVTPDPTGDSPDEKPKKRSALVDL